MRCVLTVSSRVLALVVLFAGTAAAQTSVARVEELQPVLKMGTLLTVTDASGKQTTGKLRQITDGHVFIERSTSSYSSFAFEDIETLKKTDSRTNGYWIGFAVGAVPGIVLGSFFNQYCYNESPSHCPQAIVVLGGLTGLAGGGIGWAIDSAINDGPVLYSRGTNRAQVSLRPFASPSVKGSGVALSVSF